MPKRSRSSASSKKTPYAKRAKSASKKGRTGYANVLRSSTLTRKVNSMYKMIETKESSFQLGNTQCPHNNTVVWAQTPFALNQNASDPMNGIGGRIGDSIALRGMSACFFVEGSLGRSKVNFRIMLLKGPRGATFDRADIFKGMSSNKMIDQINTEKYSIMTQKVFNVEPPNNPAASLAPLTGVVTGSVGGTTGTKIVKFWIPGKKIVKNGHIQYESGTQNVKYYDYRWVIVAYDWYGTPQDTNNVGFINECWMKIYYKDA